jgi:uncharacterized OB-fold protein
VAEVVSAMPDVLRVADGETGVLLATRCAACGALALGLRRHCPNCTSSRVTALECSTRGTLVNYTVVHRAAASWKGRVPYALGVVGLPEGIEVTAEIVGCPFEGLALGMAMRMALEVVGHTAAGGPMMLHKWTPER